MYAQFDQAVYQRFKRPVAAGAFDVVHAFTPVTPRFPVSIVRACARTPFIVGPVNGGLPYPSGFADIAVENTTTSTCSGPCHDSCLAIEQPMRTRSVSW